VLVERSDAPVTDPSWGMASATSLSACREGLETIVREAEKTRSDSLLVLVDDHVAVERYFGRPKGPIELMSGTKSVVGLAVAFLVAEGRVPSLDAPLSTWFPEWASGRKSQVTLRHVLSHTSGLEHVDGSSAKLNAQDDQLDYVRRSAVVDEPGKNFSYNNEAVMLLSGVVSAASGKPLDAYVAEKLLEPLGITDWQWKKDKAGHPLAHYGLALHARDAAKIGLFVLHEGEWKGRRLLPTAIAREVSAPAARANVWVNYLFWLDYDGRGFLQDSSRVAALAGRGHFDQSLLDPLRGRTFSMPEAWFLEAGALLPPTDREHLASGLHHETYPVTFTPGHVRGIRANGWLGQHLVVVPEERVVAVRQLRAPPRGEENNAEYNERFGLGDFPKLVNALRCASHHE
jgi:CubicO group peptidase (beta-lactamase class C family)